MKAFLTVDKSDEDFNAWQRMKLAEQNGD